MKKGTKTLMLLPLIAICLSGCYTIIPEDAPEVNEDEFTPEGSYTLPEEDTSESSSIPYESTGGTGESTGGDNTSTPSETPGGNTSSPSETPGGNTSSPSETPGGNTSSPSETPGEGNSSDSNKPSEPDDPNNPSESEQEIITYSLSIVNKSSLETVVIDHNQEENTYTYKLEFAAYSISNINGTNEAAFNESDIEVTSSDESIVSANGSCLTLTGEAGYTYIHASWTGHLDEHGDTADDYLRMSVSIIDKVTYEYTFEIVNKSDLLGTDSVWYTNDNSRSVEVALYEQEVVNGEYSGQATLKETNDVTLSQVDPTTEESVEIVSIDNLDVTPSTPGAVKIIATWDDGVNEPLSDSFEVLIEESYYDDDFKLTITNKDNFVFTEESDEAWRVGEAKTLSVDLDSNSYAYSSKELYEQNATIKGNSNNLTIAVYNEEGESVTGPDKTNDIAYYALADGTIVLNPQAAAKDNTYTIMVSWNGHEEAYDYMSVTIGSKLSEAYTMVVSSDSSEFTNWYMDDEPAKTIEYKIYDVFYDDDGNMTTANEIESQDYISDMVVYSESESVASAELQSDGSILVTAIGSGETNIYFYWSTHTEAFGFMQVSIGVHSYTLSIEASDGGLGTSDTPWRIEQGSRDITLSFTKDLVEVTNPDYVEVKETGENNLVSITNVSGSDTYTVTPLLAGNTSISATWYKDEDHTQECASAEILVYISNEQLPSYITLSSQTLEFSDIESGQSLTATVYGADNTTNNVKQDVTWSVIDGVGNIELSSTTDNTITVTAKVYSATAKIEAVSNYDATVKAQCDVTVGDAPINVTPVDSINLTYAASNVSSPDNNGVYVLGTTNGTTYIKYDNGFTTTDSYDSATAVRTIATGSGTYYLEINDEYLTSSLTLDSSIDNAAQFTIDTNGIKLDSSNVYISDGLNTTSGDMAYLLDMGYCQETVQVTSGTFKISATRNDVTYFASDQGLNSNRFYSTTDPSHAIDFTITPVSDHSENEYYMSFDNNGTTTYIYTTSSGTGVGTSTADPATGSVPSISYDSENQRWTSSGASRSFLFNYSGNGTSYFGNYEPGGSYYSAMLTTLGFKDVPAVKGLAISTGFTSYEVGQTFTPSVAFYPAVISENYSVSDVTFTQIDGDGSITIGSNGEIEATSAGSVSFRGTCGNGTSNILTITITGVTAETDPTHSGTLIGKMDFSDYCSANSSSSAFSESSLTTCLQQSYTGDSATITGTAVDRAYPGSNGTTSDDDGTIKYSLECIQIAGSSNTGSFSFTMTGTDTITSVVIKAAVYDSSSREFDLSNGTTTVGQTVAAISTNYTTWSAVSYTDSYDFSDGISSFTFSTVTKSNSRILLHSIYFYGD